MVGELGRVRIFEKGDKEKRFRPRDLQGYHVIYS
jgi:hypothetical protein